MASDQIKYNQDVANPDVQQGLDKLLATYEKINTQVTKLKSSKITIPKGSSGKDLKKINEVTKQRIANQKEVIALTKEQKKASEALEKQRAKALGQQAKVIQKEKELIATSKQQVRSIEDLRKKNNALVKIRDRVNVTTKKGATEFRKLTGAIAKNEKALKKYDKAIGRSQRNVGNYGKSIKGLASRFGGALGLVGVMLVARRALVGMFNTFKDFDKAQSKLASILGTTKEGVSGLTDTAIQLGSSMVFTASQVSELQTELAKLGFSEGEIINAQRGVLNLAAATGFDLAEAAAISGAALRSFGLDAREMGRVTDVMALATSKSALDMQKLATALPTVASTAKVAGVTIERTTALLGVLADRGLDASTSATSLRNVFLELSKQGLTWEQAMRKINSATDKNVAALELFGKRGATTGVILAQNAESADKLTVSLNGAAGAAERMAEVQLDNLAGDLTKLTSAWEGLILTIEKGDGAIANFLRGTTQAITKALNALTLFGKTAFDIELGRTLDAATKKTDEFLKNINKSIGDNEKERISAINERIKLREFEIEKFKKGLTEQDALTKKFIGRFGGAAGLEERDKVSVSLIAAKTTEIRLLKEEIDIRSKSAKQTKIDAENEKILAAELEAARLTSLGTIKGLGDEISRLNKIRNESNDPERIASLAIEIQLYKNMKKALEDLGKVPEAKARKRRELGDDPIKLADEEDLVLAERRVEETTTAMIEAIQKRAEAANVGDSFLAQLLGITDEDAENLKSSLQEIASITADFLAEQFDARADAARRRSDLAQSEIDALRQEKIAQLQVVADGDAAEIRAIDKKIEEQEELRNKALEDEAEAVRKKQALATIVQIANLALAASEIFANESKAGAPGVVLAIAAIAAMLTAFTAFKTKSVQDVNREKGGYARSGDTMTITGNRHSQGGERLIDHIVAEQGEDVSIFTRTASKNHHKLIENFTNMVNKPGFSGSLQFAKTPNIEQNDFNVMLSTAELQQQNAIMIEQNDQMIKLMSTKRQIEKGLWVDPLGNITSNRIEE